MTRVERLLSGNVATWMDRIRSGYSAATADPSTALRSGRDDKGRAVTLRKFSDLDGRILERLPPQRQQVPPLRYASRGMTCQERNAPAFGLHPVTSRRVPHTPDFLCSLVGSLNFMRLSLKKGAHAVLSKAAYRKFGASRSFFARCGIPQVFPSIPWRVPPIHTGAPRSPQRTGSKKMGESNHSLLFQSGRELIATVLPHNGDRTQQTRWQKRRVCLVRL